MITENRCGTCELCQTITGCPVHRTGHYNTVAMTQDQSYHLWLKDQLNKPMTAIQDLIARVEKLEKAAQIDKTIEAAVRAERERCARLVETDPSPLNWSTVADFIASKIRSGK